MNVQAKIPTTIEGVPLDDVGGVIGKQLAHFMNPLRHIQHARGISALARLSLTAFVLLPLPGRRTHATAAILPTIEEIEGAVHARAARAWLAGLPQAWLGEAAQLLVPAEVRGDHRLAVDADPVAGVLLALGAAASRPFLVEKAGEFLKGRRLTDEVIAQRANADAVILVPFRVRRLQRARDLIHLRLRLLERYPGLQTGDRLQIIAARLRLPRPLIGRHDIRHPRLNRPNPATQVREVRRHDAEYLVGAAFDRNRASEDRRIAAEAPAPQRIAQHDDAVASIDFNLPLREAAQSNVATALNVLSKSFEWENTFARRTPSLPVVPRSPPPR